MPQPVIHSSPSVAVILAFVGWNAWGDIAAINKDEELDYT